MYLVRFIQTFSIIIVALFLSSCKDTSGDLILNDTIAVDYKSIPIVRIPTQKQLFDLYENCVIEAVNQVDNDYFTYCTKEYRRLMKFHGYT